MNVIAQPSKGHLISNENLSIWQPQTIQLYGIFEQNIKTKEVKFDSIFIKQAVRSFLKSIYDDYIEYCNTIVESEVTQYGEIKKEIIHV